MSYVEFQREFGSAIAGSAGGDLVRWGYSSVPLAHAKAAEFSEVRALRRPNKRERKQKGYSARARA